MQTPRWLPLAGALVLAGCALLVVRLWQNGPPAPAPARLREAVQPAEKTSADASARASATASPRDSHATPEPLLSREDLLNRLAQCFAITSADERRLEFLSLLKRMNATDARAVLDLIQHEAKQGVFLAADWPAFWRRWGAVDGPAALEYHLSLPDSSWNGLDIGHSMRGWAQTNPAAAAAWLQSHPEARHFDNAFLGYIEGYASTDLPAATQVTLNSVSAGDPLMWRATEQLAEQALRQGKLAGLEAWFNALPADTATGSARHTAEDHVWWRMQVADFDTGVEWVRKHADGPWRSDHIIGEIADRLSGSDPTAAVAWLESVQASPRDGRYPGMDKVVAKWAGKDAAGFETWLTHPDGGTLRQQAMEQYAARLSETDPASANAWLQRAKTAAPAR